tara:strand:+ start:1124 stop:1462 length:339 start_codon:yes stop_codon:yes gene_type:complete
MPRRILEGTVVSDKQDKTVTVRITRRVKDDLYGKYITKSAKFAAHDEENKHVEGDVVRIEECRPISKNKSWRVMKEGEKPTPTAEDKKKKTSAKKKPKKKADAKKTTKKDDK